RLESQSSSRTGENPPYGMIGRVEETSASFEARSAPRSYPTPISGHTHRSKKHYSITSSARASSVGGTSRPTAPLRWPARVGGHREVKNGTGGQVGGHPQPTPMGVNDRPANRQPHPHAVRFGRKQWIEHPINGARLNTLPRVLHGHHHTAGVVDFRP